MPPKKQNGSQNCNILIDAQENRIDTYEVIPNLEKGMTKYALKPSIMEFKRGLVHNFCSCTCIDHENIILVGGCKEFDVNMKSHDILKLNLISK